MRARMAMALVVLDVAIPAFGPTLDAIIANRDTVIANGLPLNPVREDLVAFLQAVGD